MSSIGNWGNQDNFKPIFTNKILNAEKRKQAKTS